MAGIPIYIEQILKINAHTRFYIRWLDDLANLSTNLNYRIDRVA